MVIGQQVRARTDPNGNSRAGYVLYSKVPGTDGAFAEFLGFYEDEHRNAFRAIRKVFPECVFLGMVIITVAEFRALQHKEATPERMRAVYDAMNGD